MNFKFISILLGLLFAISLVYATLDTASSLNDLPRLKNTVNEGLNHLPGLVRIFLGNLDINVHYTLNQSVREFNLVLNGGLVDSLQEVSTQHPDLDLYVSDQDVQDISNAANVRTEIKNKLNNNQLRIETHGIIALVKLRFAKTFL